MKNSDMTYIDLYGEEWNLNGLDAKERHLLADLHRFAEACENARGKAMQRWCDFDNCRIPKIIEFYESRGLTRKQIAQTVLHRIGQDLSSRLGIALGVVRKPDYRGHLNKIIQKSFKTKREFCKATGLSEDMLSHVLAGRKDLSVKALSQALGRIGYTIRLVPDKQRNKSA